MAAVGDPPATYPCCGVPIAALTPDSARAQLLRSRFGQARATHLCNAYTLSLAVRDSGYRRLLRDAELNISDGHWVPRVGHRRGHPEVGAAITGPELMLAVLDSGRAAGLGAAGQGLRHYLYGASPDTVARLQTALSERLPGVRIVGGESPPFRALTPAEETRMITRLRALEPDVVWVGIGTPRQDEFVHAYTASLDCTVVPVGAAFDFHSGNKTTAPAWVRSHGLEWAYRLATEPRRLWRRYLVGNPVFLYGVAREGLSRRR